MAKLETKLKGQFNDFVSYLKKSILQGSVSASLEEESYLRAGDADIAVIAFERYSYFGGNRVGMTVTIVGRNNDLLIVGVSTGGSRAMFLKINTIGEDAFLDKLHDVVDKFARK